jgi:hypothetical protein
VLVREYQDELHQLADDMVQKLTERRQIFRHLADVVHHLVVVVGALQNRDAQIQDVVLTFHRVHLVVEEHLVVKRLVHLADVELLVADLLDVDRPVLRYQMDYFLDALADEVQVELFQKDYFQDVHLQQEEDLVSEHLLESAQE